MDVPTQVVFGPRSVLHTGRDATRLPNPRPAGAGIRPLHEVTPNDAIAVLEGELQRIAGDLHDTAAQALALVRLSLEAIAREADAGTAARVAGTMPIVDEAIAQVRELIFGLRPPLLDELGLAAALRWSLATQARAARLQADFHAAPGLGRLPADIEIAGFRIAQEAISNALRHAGATRIRVSIDATPGSFRVEVSDDGRGMTHAATGVVDGRPTLGLRSMRERAAALGGRVELTSSPGHGTRVVAVLPVRRWPDP